MAVAAEPGAPAGHALARRGPRARARAQPRPAAPHVHRRLRDAGLRLPQAARRAARAPRLPARVRRAGPARRALLVHRRAPARASLRWSLRRRRRPLRDRRRGGRPPPPGAAAGPAAVRRRRGRLLRLRPRAHRRAARRAQPRPGRPARHGAHAVRRARGLRPPQAHGHDPRQRLRRGRGRGRGRLRRRAGDDRQGARGCSPARCPTVAPDARARASRASARTCRARRSRAWSPRIVEYVHAGDAFQVVPSQRWSAELDADPFSVYRGLRVVNPSPYMYFLDFLDFQVAGASPEPLLTVTGRHVSTRPIAGHAPARRRRGRGRRHRRGAAGRREGARRARDARRPRPQRPRARVRVRQRRRRHVHGRRDLQPRHAHRLERLGPPARGRRRDGRAALAAAGGHAVAARRRCARCRSSTSSSRSSAAATAAPSAT